MSDHPSENTILLVEDDQSVAEVLKDILEADDYHVDWTSNGKTALGILSDTHYGLIICDFVLPDLDGEGLYRELAKRRPDLLSRVVFISGHCPTRFESFLKTSGAPFVTKPFYLDDLRRTVEHALKAAA